MSMTFLFSDIEGSTTRWETDPAAMELALSRHDAIVRGSIEANGGRVFKTMGDAFYAVFPAADRAVPAALAAQRALAAEDFSAVGGIRVRMALHTGESTERDGDHFGPAVNRVARLLAIGHGGQVLVSAASAGLLEGEMPAQSDLLDLGPHRLKDLALPEQVYQLVAHDLSYTFPPLRSLDQVSNNLPAQLTSFVGRDDVVSEVVALLAGHRLVAMVGSGGAGKTRCAVQVGAEFLSGSGHAVWLSELAAISDPALVAGTIARAVNVQEAPHRPMLEILIAYLRRRRLLLILDNCEHVIDEARRLVTAILHDCPDVRILATSREALNVAGEHVYRMPPLSVAASVALFTDRASASDARFALTDENAPYVEEIVHRLDGIPLAIELAAARVRVLTPRQLADKLDQRFRLLTGGDRSALRRHQTMRALIDWSYDLLSEDERSVFRKLSIFVGGFTLASASAVCTGDPADELATLEFLSSLVDKSLVLADSLGAITRYRILESTREYARERLSESGELELTAHRHAVASLALAAELDRTWESTPDREWLAQAEPDLENFRAALSWTLGDKRDPELGAWLVATLGPLWGFRQFEGRRWLQTAREQLGNDAPPALLAGLDLVEAAFSGTLNQFTLNLAAGERALARYNELGEELKAADAERHIGYSLVMLGEIARGEAVLSRALVKARALGAHRLTSTLLSALGNARGEAGRSDAGDSLLQEALTIARASGADRQGAIIAANLAEEKFREGDVAAAVELCGEARAIYRSFNDTTEIPIALCNLSAYRLALGEHESAAALAREALAAARDSQMDMIAVVALQHLAAAAALRAEIDESALPNRLRSARLLGYVDARYAELGAHREYTEQREYDAASSALRGALGADVVAKLMAEGGGWSEEQAFVEAAQS